ncbi:MAG: acyl-CoA dehydrogenase family protein [Paracoccus sp. (in: a-proteobacteria)]|jgi:alkylation response protein AidB-like acyl-CoA dehydrogenase|uniref:acyl-CoA dehydrogenase family protein n=3 Tax=Paracoccus TaxID=265 RepID=UPI000C3BC4F5|nr:acyl-CoA dehydrogenase family protein [Paracoccus sp. (in: a-proteobacteria)]MAN55453.1 acyl-CoA dehydrogenase [Paracoccus sp. (in: a-proteobacteria)]MBA49234.1 acyl-CoA dehydrogenase [Paracoccus sp. (in: a-proteobacteria)]MCS5601278.1 acyl-CoA dehydrogenase family protein [Paracoccus sp. (in: a-proteobacteria)]|tara:strand:+ start:125 stop:1270 length:1146 start_codon:yes stop_codon:yes gene_type:complete
MDFALSEEQQAIFDMARDFGQRRIAPHAREWEAAGTIPRDLWTEIAQLGFGGLYVGEEHGGSGLGRLDATLVFEALAMADPAVGSFLSIHNMCGGMIDTFGDPETKARWLPGLCSMETIFSYCLTEPGSGSDAAALRTRADRTNEGWRLNGTKAFISGGGYSDAYIAMVRTGTSGPRGISAVIVENGSSGLSFGSLEDKMGWRAQPTTQVQFDDCLVPADNLLGEEGRGFAYAMAGLDGGRLNISAGALGGAQAALDATMAYMGQRTAFGQSLDRFQALQFRLAEMETALQSARIFLRQAAWKLDQQAPDATKFCAMAKLLVTDRAFEVANQCLQLHGGYGYLADYGIEKIVRDLRVHQILEGTNEIMRLIVSRAMLAERG